MIELSNLSVGYKRRGGCGHVVAAGMNATLRRGRLTCLIGPNGAGKSTLLKTMTAFLPPLAGEICYYSCPGGDSPSLVISSASSSVVEVRREASRLARLVSVVLTERPDIKNMTVREIVALGRSPYTGFWGIMDGVDNDIVDESMSLAGIASLSRRDVQTLSDGERQKMMIAKALAQRTPVIVLDEPTAFLDYPSKVETMGLLRRLCHEEGKTVLLSTHDIEIAMQVCDTLWLMADGSLATGTPAELAANGVLSLFIDREGISLDTRTLSIRIG